MFNIDGLPDNGPFCITQPIKRPGPDGEAMDTGHAYGDGFARKATSKAMHLNSGDDQGRQEVDCSVTTRFKLHSHKVLSRPNHLSPM